MGALLPHSVFYLGNKEEAAKHLGVAQKFLSVTEQQATNNNEQTYLTKSTTLADGTGIRVLINNGIRTIWITGVGGKTPITPSKGFRFTPWEDDCPDAIVTKDASGTWEVTIVDLDGGTRVNGESPDQYLSIYSPSRNGDYINYLQEFSSFVHKDGYRIFANQSYVYGATIYNGYFVVFTGYLPELKMWVTPAVNVITDENKDSLVWTEVAIHQIPNMGNYSDVLTPISFPVGSPEGHFIHYGENIDSITPSYHSKITIEIDPDTDTFDFSILIQNQYLGSYVRTRTYTPAESSNHLGEGTSSILEQNVWSSAVEAKSPYPADAGVTTYIYSGCMEWTSCVDWCNALWLQHDYRRNPNYENWCSYPMVVAGGLGRESENPPEPYFNYTYYIVDADVTYDIEYFSGQTPLVNNGSTNTATYTDQEPVVQTAGLLNGNYVIGLHSYDGEYDRYGYDDEIQGPGRTIGSCGLDDFNVYFEECPASEFSAAAAKIDGKATNSVWYAGGDLLDRWAQVSTGHLGDFYFENYTNTSCSKVGKSTYGELQSGTTPQRGQCNPVSLGIVMLDCESDATDPTCESSMNMSGVEREDATIRYIPLAEGNTKLDFSWYWNISPIPSTGYFQKGTISQQTQIVPVEYSYNFTINGRSFPIEGLGPTITKNLPLTASLSTGILSGSNDTTKYSIWPNYKFLDNYNVVCDIHKNMLFSIFAVWPVGVIWDWEDDIEGNTFRANRFIYDSDKDDIIDLIPLYNEAIAEYNTLNGTTHGYMQENLLADTSIVEPLQGMGVL